MQTRRAILFVAAAAALALVAALAALGRNVITRRVEASPYAPLSIRSFDVVADGVPLHGTQLATVIVCNSSARAVEALESLSWQGGVVPQTMYGDVVRSWRPGCTPLALRVPAELERRTYRLQMLEVPLRPDGGIGSPVWAMSPPFTIT